MKFVWDMIETDELRQAPLLVALFTLPWLALFFYIRYVYSEMPFSAETNAFTFFLAMAASSAVLRLFSSGIGRVVFQGFCAFVCLAGIAVAAHGLWQLPSAEIKFLLLPKLVAGLGLARAAWWARSSDQKAWKKQQETPKP